MQYYISKYNSDYNGKNVLLGGFKSTDIGTSGYKNVTLNSSILEHKLIRFNCSYYIFGAPDYGGTNISVKRFVEKHNQEGITVFSFDTASRFTIKYVNATTIAVIYTGTLSEHICMAVIAIL